MQLLLMCLGKKRILKFNISYSDNQKTMEWNRMTTLSYFDVVTKQIFLLVNWSIYAVQLLIAMSNVHCTSLSPNLSLKVVFLFQSFLLITVKIH